MTNQELDNSVNQRVPLWEKIAIFAFGIVFLVLLLLLAIAIPNPSAHQVRVFNTVLALSAAGVAALIPGFIEVKYKTLVRAGGAAAVFFLVYWFNPAQVVAPDIRADTQPFKINALKSAGGVISHQSFTFPLKDVRSKDKGKEFLEEIMSKLPGVDFDRDSYIVFRMSDEIVVTDNISVTEGNNCILSVPIKLIEEYESEHYGFSFIRSHLPVQDQCLGVCI